MITTAGHTRWPSDHAMRDLRPKGLRVACVVRWKLLTLDNRALRRASVIFWATTTRSDVALRLQAFWTSSGTTERIGPDAAADVARADPQSGSGAMQPICPLPA